MRIQDTFEYTTGLKAAARAFKACRTACKAPWRQWRPDWASAPGPRAYAWYVGFQRTWNALAGHAGWPAWTSLRCRVVHGIPDDGEDE